MLVSSKESYSSVLLPRDHCLGHAVMEPHVLEELSGAHDLLRALGSRNCNTLMIAKQSGSTTENV